MKKAEYREGPQAGENFKRLATALLQKPKKHSCPVPASGWCIESVSLPVSCAYLSPFPATYYQQCKSVGVCEFIVLRRPSVETKRLFFNAL